MSPRDLLHSIVPIVEDIAFTLKNVRGQILCALITHKKLKIKKRVEEIFGCDDVLPFTVLIVIMVLKSMDFGICGQSWSQFQWIPRDYCIWRIHFWTSQVTLVVRNPPASAGDTRDTGSVPGSGRCPGKGNGHPLQYSCLENRMDRGAWRGAAHSVTESDTTEATQHARMQLILCILRNCHTFPK